MKNGGTSVAKSDANHTVVAAAAHTGSYGLRLTNTSGEFDVVVKPFSSAFVDSSVSFWVRVSSGGGLQTVAEARDQRSSNTMWALLYDGAHQAFYFYPCEGSASTEIFTGGGSAPANSWINVDVQYTARSTGGAQLYVNGQTNAAWGVSGNYTRSTNFQRLQLWNGSSISTTDFDDVQVAIPSTGSAPTTPGAPSIVQGTPGNGSVARSWSAPGSNGGSAVTGYQVTPYLNGSPSSDPYRLDRHRLHRHGPDRRDRVHVHGRRDQRRRHRPGVARVRPRHANGDRRSAGSDAGDQPQPSRLRRRHCPLFPEPRR